MEHPAPWRIVWHDPGESWGYASLTKIVDRNGCFVLRVETPCGGDGHDQALADRIVAAINRTELVKVKAAEPKTEPHKTEIEKIEKEAR